MGMAMEMGKIHIYRSEFRREGCKRELSRIRPIFAFNFATASLTNSGI